MRNKAAGRYMRPYCSNRGQKSVIRNESPLASETTVTRMLVLGRYCWDVVRCSGAAGVEIAKRPPLGSRIPPNTGGLSGRGRHIQSTDPESLISAETWQLPTNP